MAIRTITAPIAFISLLFSIGCLDELPNVTTVENLRILGIQASSPEVDPGETLEVQILTGNASPGLLTLEWYLCARPERGSGFLSGSSATGASGGQGYGLDNSLSCIDAGRNGASDVQYLGDSSRVSVTIPDDLFDDKDTMANLYGLPKAVDDSVFTLLNGIAGVNLTVAVRVSDGDEERDAYKRINVSDAPDTNDNPVSLALHITPDGSEQEPPTQGEPPGQGRCFLREAMGPIAAAPGVYRITPVNIPNPQAEYSVLFVTPDPQEPIRIEQRSEEYFYSFFTNRGSFSDAIIKGSAKAGTTLTIPESGPEEMDIWIVVRDGRGGTSWCQSQLQIIEDP